MAEKKKPATPELDTEVATRQRDPFENDYLGVLRSNDPLLLEKGQNVELYRDLKRDGKVFSTLQKRIGALVGRAWTVEPINAADAADADAVTAILKAINFDQLCRDLLDALMMGYSVSEIVWTVRENRIVPARVIKRRQRRFVYVQPEGGNAGPELRLLTQANLLTGEALPEKKFIVHRCNPEDDNPYGTGLGLQLYWPVFFKRKGIISWNKLNDRFGSPTPWGRYPKNASPKEKSTLFAALKAISNDGVVMTPEGMQLELLESKLTGSVTTQQSLCEFMDDWIGEVVLGQEARASGGKTGAASKERAAVRLDLVQADADLLSETLNSTLIAWICEYNGLAPCLVYRDISEEEDKKAESETDKNISEMGFELSEAAVQAKYGDGWKKKAEPIPLTPPNGAIEPKKQTETGDKTASFAEGDAQDDDAGQRAIDAAIDAVPSADLRAALDGLLEPLLEAIEQANSFEEALIAAEAAFPKMDSNKLQALLARAMFGAEAFGRQSDG